MLRHLLIICLFLNVSAQAQQITEIQFSGLQKTRTTYLQQFLLVKVGDTLNLKKLSLDKQNLTNLEVLANASYQLNYLDSNRVGILFTCEELYTLLPILNFGSLTRNSWIQIGASEANLFGRGHKAYAYYQYYDRNSLAFHLNLNRIYQSKWGINLNFVKWSTIEPLYFNSGTVSYNYDQWSYGLDLKYQANLQHEVLLGFNYFTEEYRAVSERVAEAPAYAFKKKILGKFRYSYQRLNHFYFYTDGLENVFNFQTVYSAGIDPQFFIFFNDLKTYRRIAKRGNFASRLRIGLSTNENSPFAPFVLDSYLNIRGVGNRVDRGTGTIVANLEYRHALIDKKKLALQLNGFLDMGAWRKPGGELNDFSQLENQEYFSGIGVRLIHKRIYQAILRIDYGLDIKNSMNRGLVIGLGQYF